MFKEKINHTTGEREWVVSEDDFDVAQELARSRFGDMILDQDRNDMYLAGLKTVIEEKKASGERVHVLDIGTGTGLLSLMAAREGADQVTALEVFKPMADCATKITGDSQWNDKITSMFSVVSSRSTDLSHLGEKPNVIVAEVFDTELNGEGALRTFKEALINLVQPGCRVVPSVARVWILPVSSKFLKDFNRVPTLFDDAESPLGSCAGTAAVFDLQLSRVDPTLFTPLSDPVQAFWFDFEHAEKILYDETAAHEVACSQTGDVDAIMMWWDLHMDRTGRHFINMAPSWFYKESAWRDHWMQAVYYLPHRAAVKKGERFKINCYHDEFSMWFSIGEPETVDRPYCNCRLHTLLSRQSVYSLNSLSNDKDFADFVEKTFASKSVVVLGEGSLLGVLAAKHASNVVIVESNSHFRLILHRYIRHYKLTKKVHVVDSPSEVVHRPDAILSEPFYLSAMNPWQNLRFWHEAQEIRQRLGQDIPVYPQKALLRGLLEKFVHLQSIASPVGTVNGFDLSHFDEISHKAREATDAIVDEQPLWEYEGRATSESFTVCSFDLSSAPSDVSVEHKMPISEGTNALPLWMDWDFGDGYIRTTGTRQENISGKDPNWNIGVKQGVYFLTPSLLETEEMSISVEYQSQTGEMLFKFV